MSLQPAIKAAEQKSSFYVYDCTGDFSGDNSGGFGGPNPKRDDVEKATLFIKPPKATEYIEIDYTGDLPNKEGTPVEITPLLAKLSCDSITSGKWSMKLEYQVRVKGVLKTRTGYYVTVFVNDISCCIDNHIPSLNENCMNDEAQKTILKYSNLLEGAKKLIKKGLYDQADKTIDNLNSQCKCSGCH